jgi:putative holliday junction resolvase
MRYLGIDYGLKKIGFALGDDESSIAAPIEVIQNDGPDKVIKALNTLVQEESIEAFVIGIPWRPEGLEESPQKKKNEDFAELVKERIGLPVHLVNEQFTSVESRRLQVEHGAGAKEDALAAMLILQEYLDGLRQG